MSVSCLKPGVPSGLASIRFSREILLQRHASDVTRREGSACAPASVVIRFERETLPGILENFDSKNTHLGDTASPKKVKIVVD